MWQPLWSSGNDEKTTVFERDIVWVTCPGRRDQIVAARHLVGRHSASAVAGSYRKQSRLRGRVAGLITFGDHS